MPFEREDFFVGMIAYFTVNELRRHPRIRTLNPTRDTKARPFVCFAEQHGECYWVGLTGTWHPQRRTVSRKHLRYASGRFLSGDLIVADGRATFVGPIDAFCALSNSHDVFNGYRRPFVTAEGVDEVLTIVGGRGGLMPALPPVMQPMVLAAAA